MKIGRLLIIICLLIIITQITSAQNGIRLELVLEKTQFFQGEEITCEAVVSNVSNVELKVIEPSNQVGCTYKLFNEKGEEIKYTGPYYSGTWPKFNLKPGDKLFYIDNISKLFGTKSIEIFDQILDTGHYILYAHYWSGNGDTANAKTSFDVNTPKGKDKLAYNDITNIIKERKSNLISTIELFVSKEQDFAQKYPNSIYTPIVLSNMSAYLYMPLKQENRAIEIRKHILENYPDYVAVNQGLLDSKPVSELSDEEKKIFIKKVYKRAKSKFAHLVIEKYSQKHKLKIDFEK